MLLTDGISDFRATEEEKDKFMKINKYTRN